MTQRFGKVLLGGALVGVATLVVWLTWTTPQPSRIEASPVPAPLSARVADPLGGGQDQEPGGAPAVSVQDALLRRVDLPFGEPTPLADVQKYLGETLGLGVVLDRAALDRLDIDPEDTVQLNIRGVRLKTGLKLLLDQVDMTYRVEAEDNLLILTDARESSDPSVRALVEIRALHDEVHDLQDAVDDLRDLVEEDMGVEPAATEGVSVFVRARPDRPGQARTSGRRQPRRALSRPR